MKMISLWFLLGTCICLARVKANENTMDMGEQLQLLSSDHMSTVDACLANSCEFGHICKSVPIEQNPAGFVCLRELEFNKEPSAASQVYRNFELLAKEAIRYNLNIIMKNGKVPTRMLQMLSAQKPITSSNNEQTVSLTLRTKKPIKLTCEQKPCHEGERCVMKPDSLEGYTCVRERIMVVQNENIQIEKLNSSETFRMETISRCKLAFGTTHQRLDIAGHPTLYIDCHDQNGLHDIMTCPDGYLFNKFLDRCDHDQEPMNLGCASSPCLFGAVCHDLPNFDHRCDCPPGFSGKNCQQVPDVCAAAPCGHADGNVCHVVAPESGLAYFCTCFNGKGYGLSCDEDKVEKNPCDENFQVGSVFSTRLGASVFGVCDEDRRLSLRVCDKQMQAAGNCKWLSKLGSQRARRASRARKHSRNPFKKHH